MVVEIHMKPLAACVLGVLSGDGKQSFPDSLPAGTMCHQSVFDERVRLTVPDHVDEAYETLFVARCDPPQAEAREQVSPIVVDVRMIEAFRVQPVDFFVPGRTAPFKSDRHAEQHYR